MNFLDRIKSAWNEFRNADNGGDTGNPIDALPDVGFVPLADLTPPRNVAIYSLNNPLEWLSPRNAYYMLMRLWYGEYTRVQWVMDWAEKYDADIMAISNRIAAGLRTMDIGIQVKPQTDPALKEKALAQKAELDKVLAAICKDTENDQSVTLKEAIMHLGLANIREFAHVGHYEKDGKIHLQNMRQLNVIRHGDSGKWLWNAANMITDFNMTSLQAMNPADFIIRYHPRSILRIAVIKFIRANCSQEWWDAFCERVSKNAWVLTAPESVGNDPKQIAAFNAAGQGLRRAGTGTVPWDTEITSLDAKRGGSVPFHEHMAWLQDQIWLAATSQQLSGLSKSVGLGGGPLGDQHGDILNELISGIAEEISELVNEALFTPVLAAKFPNDPPMAYWCIKSQNEKTSTAILDDVVKIKQGGGQPDWNEISERTGYKITAAPLPAAPGSGPNGNAPPDDEDDPDADVENRDDDGTQARDEKGRFEACSHDFSKSRDDLHGNSKAESGFSMNRITQGERNIAQALYKNGKTGHFKIGRTTAHVVSVSPFQAHLTKKESTWSGTRDDVTHIREVPKAIANRFDLANRAAEANGIPASWLNPLASFMEDIANNAPDPLTPEYVDSILPAFKKRVPEIFANMDTDALAAWLNRGMQGAALEQVRKYAKKRGELKNADFDSDGKWVTVEGRHVFIKDGESLDDAMKNKGIKISGEKEHESPVKNFEARKEFKTSEKKVNEQHSRLVAGNVLSSSQSDALKEYQDSKTYREINGALRSGKDVPKSNANTVAQLDSIFEKSALPEKVTTYRGASLRAFGLTDADVSQAGAAALIGKSIQDKGYVSSTLAGDKTSTFVRGVAIKISAAKGSKAIAIGANASGGFDEKEVLFPRNSKFKITSAGVVNLGAGQRGLEIEATYE